MALWEGKWPSTDHEGKQKPDWITMYIFFLLFFHGPELNVLHLFPSMLIVWQKNLFGNKVTRVFSKKIGIHKSC